MYSNIAYQNQKIDIDYLCEKADLIKSHELEKIIQECTVILDNIINHYFKKVNDKILLKLQILPFETKDKKWIISYAKFVEKILSLNNKSQISINFWNYNLFQLFISNDYDFLKVLSSCIYTFFLKNESNINIANYFSIYFSKEQLPYICSYLKELNTLKIPLCIGNRMKTVDSNITFFDSSYTTFKYDENINILSLKNNVNEIITFYFYGFPDTKYLYLFKYIGVMFCDYLSCAYIEDENIIEAIPSDFVVNNFDISKLFLNNLLKDEKPKYLKRLLKRFEFYLKVLSTKDKLFMRTLKKCSNIWVEHLIYDKLKKKYTIQQKISIIHSFIFLKFPTERHNIQDLYLLLEMYDNNKCIRSNVLKTIALNENLFFRTIILEMFFYSSDIEIKKLYYTEYLPCIQSQEVKNSINNEINNICNIKLRQISVKLLFKTYNHLSLFELLYFKIKADKTAFFSFNNLAVFLNSYEKYLLICDKGFTYLTTQKFKFIFIITRLKVLLKQLYPEHFKLFFNYKIIGKIFKATKLYFPNYYKLFPLN
ncbi:hypothetical protein TCON_0847 [Astathelohania contejeani]|uniref:Uncharacterized protein n=1 Tax=Astathelohania contejeani TaxID=164912 RepID=A0ABQ7I0H2_9MICR|nr:hypothetical protein TCON_0847 [Thelohania contejeani]